MDEHEAAHPLLLKSLKISLIPFVQDYHWIKWLKAGSPLLTDRTKKILEAVEYTVLIACDDCSEYDNEKDCDPTICTIAPILKAWKGKQ